MPIIPYMIFCEICQLLKICRLAGTSLSLRRHTHRPLAKRLMHMAQKSGNT